MLDAAAARQPTNFKKLPSGCSFSPREKVRMRGKETLKPPRSNNPRTVAAWPPLSASFGETILLRSGEKVAAGRMRCGALTSSTAPRGEVSSALRLSHSMFPFGRLDVGFWMFASRPSHFALLTSDFIVGRLELSWKPPRYSICGYALSPAKRRAAAVTCPV